MFSAARTFVLAVAAACSLVCASGQTLSLLAPTYYDVAGSFANETYRVIATQEGASMSYNCFITSTGSLFCWTALGPLLSAGGTGTDRTWTVAPPTMYGATRFINVQVTPSEIIGLTDVGSIVFCMDLDCGSNLAYHPGPFLEFRQAQNSRDWCAIQYDGELVCSQWTYSMSRNAQGYLQAAEGQAATPNFCGTSCVSTGGPYRALDLLDATYCYNPTRFMACVLRAVDSTPVCTAYNVPTYNNTLLPVLRPLVGWADAGIGGVPLRQILPRLNYYSDPTTLRMFGVPRDPANTTTIIDSWPEGAAMGRPHTVELITYRLPDNSPTRPRRLISTTTCGSWGSSVVMLSESRQLNTLLYGWGGTDQGLYGFVMAAVPKFLNWQARVGSIAEVAIGRDQQCVLPTGDAAPHCFTYMGDSNKQIGYVYRDDSPLIPPASSINASLAVGFRGLDQLCVQASYIDAEQETPAPTAAYRWRCFGAQSRLNWWLSPNQAMMYSAPFSQLAAGPHTVCALGSGDGPLSVRCWGQCTSEAACGDAVLLAADTSSRLAVASTYACVVNVKSSWSNTSCVGSGAPTWGDASSPYTLPARYSAVSIAAADTFTCVALTNSSVYCYGSIATLASSAESAAAGTGGFGAAAPEAVALNRVGATSLLLAGPLRNVTAGTDFFCGWTSTDRLLCLGSNSSGQLAVPAVTARSWSLAHTHGCLLRSGNQAISCWGSDATGAVSGSSLWAHERFDAVLTTRFSSCGINTANRLRCWGSLTAYSNITVATQPVRWSLTDSIPPINVGAVGSDDATCSSTFSCATLAGAIAVAVTSTSRVIVVRSSTLVVPTPLSLPVNLLAGLVITGWPQGMAAASRPVLRFTGSGTNLINISTGGVQFANVVLDGTGATGCSDGILLPAVFTSFVNVTIQNVRCTSSILSMRTTTGGIIATSEDPSVDTLSLDTVVMTALAAPAIIRAWNVPSIRLFNVNARAEPSSVSAFVVMRWAGRLLMMNSVLQGFSAGPNGVPRPSALFTAAADCGGAISAADVRLISITDSSIINSTAAGGMGAALCAVGTASVSISGSSIRGATAASHGGALYLNATGTITLTNTLISDAGAQRADAGGGCLFLMSPSDVRLDGVTLLRCASGGEGGGVYLAGVPTVTLTRSNITSCSTAGRGGGVMAVNVRTLVMTNTTISNSSAGSSGGGAAVACGELPAPAPPPGATALQASCTASVSNSLLVDNYAKSAGGGLATSAGIANIPVVATLVNVVFRRDGSLGPGGGLRYDAGGTAVGTVLVLTRTLFENCTGQDGGGLSVAASGTSFPDALVSDCAFNGNSATNTGGGLSSSLLGVMVTTSNFTGNIARRSGGGLYARRCVTDVDRCVFSSNEATNWGGGGVAVDACVGRLSIALLPREPDLLNTTAAAIANNTLGTVFAGNYAGMFGGALYSTGCDVIFRYAILSGNTAGGSGGGIAIDSPASGTSISLGPLVAVRNRAISADGGALFVRGASAPMSMCQTPAAAVGASAGDSGRINSATTDSVPTAAAHGVWMRRALAAALALTPATTTTTTTAVGADSASAAASFTDALLTNATTPVYPALLAYTFNSTVTDRPGLCTAVTLPYPLGASQLNASWSPPVLAVATGNPAASIPYLINVSVSTVSNGTFSCIVTVNMTYGPLQTPAVPLSTYSGPMCVMLGNAAVRGKGGDVYQSQSLIDTSAITLSRMVSLQAYAGRGGGSVALDGVDVVDLSALTLNQSIAGDALQATATTGGGLLLRSPLVLTLRNTSFTRCAAHSGGALWLARTTSSAAAASTDGMGARRVRLLRQLQAVSTSADSVLFDGLLFDSNLAYHGGANAYWAEGDPVPCSHCVVLSSSRSLFYGADGGSGPRSTSLAPSPYWTQITATDGRLRDALVVVSSIAVVQPLLQLSVLDVYGSLVASDNSTTCLISGTRNDTGAIVTLGFMNRYTAVNGVVSIFPFSVASGPGMEALLRIDCTAGDGRALSPWQLPLATSTVRVTFTADTLAAPIFVLPGSAENPYPPSRSIGVQVVDGSGGAISAVSVRCSVSVASATDYQGARITATLVGDTQANTVGGVARFSPGIQVSSNSTVMIEAACTWISGDSVSSDIRLTLQAYALRVVWSAAGSTGVCNCSATPQPPAACTSPCSALAAAPPGTSVLTDTTSQLMWYLDSSAGTVGAVLRRLLPEGLLDPAAEPESVPAALPSSVDISSLQLLQPHPAAIMLLEDGDGNISVIRNPPLPCTLTVRSDYPASAWAAASAATGPDALTLRAATAALTGTAFVLNQQGKVLFDRVGVRGAGFGGAVPLLVSCTWVTGEVITSEPLMARTNRLRLRIAQPPPAIVLPTNPSALYPWSPPPVVEVQLCASLVTDPVGYTGSGVVGYQAFAYSSMVCTASITALDQNTLQPYADPTVQLLGTTSVNTVGGMAEYSRLSAGGAFGRLVSVSFACPWISDDVPTAQAPATNFPAILISWVAGNVTVLGAGSTVVGTAVLPPQWALYNTPLDTLAVQLSYKLVNGTIGTQWSDIGVDAASVLRCGLSAAVASVPVVLTGTTSGSPRASDGIVAFSDVAMMPALPTSYTQPLQDVVLTVTCTAQGSVIDAPVSATVTMQRLSITLMQAPPSSTLPSSASQPRPFEPTVRIAILNTSGGILEDENSATCTVSVVSQSFAPWIPASLRQVSLSGALRATTVSGVASFLGLAVSGPLGSQAMLSFACTRAQGGVVFPTTASIIIDVLQAEWQPPLPSSYWLYNSPVPLSLKIKQFTPDPAADWQVQSGVIMPAAGLQCTLDLEVDTGGNSSSTGNVAGPMQLRLSSPDFDNGGVSDAAGVVAFLPAFAGAVGASGVIRATCVVADQSFTTAVAIPVEIESILIHAVVPPPTAWLPSFSTARTPIVPAPQIVMRTLHGDLPVDAREAVCRVAVLSPNASILEPPLAGYKVNFVYSAQLDADGTLLPANETEVALLASTTPIVLQGVLIQSLFGAILEMSIACTRSQGDTTVPYTWLLRMLDADIVWLQQPPESVVSQRAFSAAVSILDLGEAPAAGDNSTAVLDGVTVCTMYVLTQDPSIILQNNVAQARGGVVQFTGVSLAARSGSAVDGYVACQLGELHYPRVLTWRIVMEACPRGTAPAGAGGYTCEQCGSGTYSDGGPNVLKCTKCPRKGVDCSGGVLRLLPGYYRVPDGRDSIDELTELHPCWNQRGCFVQLNSSYTNRSWQVTHRCEEGYTGPLCGICDAENHWAKTGGACTQCWPRLANLTVLSLLPFGLFAFVVYISIFRKIEKSAPSQVLLRILLTYMQTLGTLSSIYIARGTATFRDVFGFSQAVGDSPLQLTPVQCELRLSYYVRFGITVGLPFIIAIASLVVNVVWLTGKRLQDGTLEGGPPAGNPEGRARRQRWSVKDTMGEHAPVLLALQGREAEPSKLSNSSLVAAAGSFGPKRWTVREIMSSGNKNSSSSDSGGVQVYVNPLVAAGKSKRWVTSTGEQGGDPVAWDAPTPAAAGDSVAKRLLCLTRARNTRVRLLSASIRSDIATFFRTRAWMSPVIFVLNAGYATLTTTCFAVFNCMPMAVAGVVYLSTDLSVDCNSETHVIFKTLAGLLIAGFGFGFPLLFAWLLRSHRHELHKPEVFERLGFIYDGYAIERGMYAWESVVMVRKALVVMLGATVKDPTFQIAGSITLMTLSLFLQANYQPYSLRLFNLLEGATICSIVMTQLISLFYLRLDNFMTSCLGSDPSTVVDSQGTTCADVAADAKTNDILVTVAMVALNGISFATMAVLMARMWVAEKKVASPDGLVASGIRRMSTASKELKGKLHKQRKGSNGAVHQLSSGDINMHRGGSVGGGARSTMRHLFVQLDPDGAVHAHCRALSDAGSRPSMRAQSLRSASSDAALSTHSASGRLQHALADAGAADLQGPDTDTATITIADASLVHRAAEGAPDLQLASKLRRGDSRPVSSRRVVLPKVTGRGGGGGGGSNGQRVDDQDSSRAASFHGPPIASIVGHARARFAPEAVMSEDSAESRNGRGAGAGPEEGQDGEAGNGVDWSDEDGDTEANEKEQEEEEEELEGAPARAAASSSFRR